MLTQLTIRNFKNFKEATLPLGPFSLLVGANASGKSNIRDALRFLHGVARGYNLAEILGEKYGEGGERQWRGVRGGAWEICFSGEASFTLSCQLLIDKTDVQYEISVSTGWDMKTPRIIDERLSIDHDIFHSYSNKCSFKKIDSNPLFIRIGNTNGQKEVQDRVIPHTRPVLSQLVDGNIEADENVKLWSIRVLHELRSMRFLDLDPDAMRIPSLPGQTVLGDRGENLSSVLYSICQDKKKSNVLLHWLKELTPMDAKDVRFFNADPTGRVFVGLVETNDSVTSAYSASDGTLRFLGMIAALLGPEPARCYFLEEIENGIHPTRLHLLTQLIEQRVAEGDIQMIATTHSPELLRMLSEESLEHASLVYRLPGRNDAQIRRIVGIPHAKELIEKQSLSRLHSTGWLEDAVAFTDDEQA